MPLCRIYSVAPIYQGGGAYIHTYRTHVQYQVRVDDGPPGDTYATAYQSDGSRERTMDNELNTLPHNSSIETHLCSSMNDV